MHGSIKKYDSALNLPINLSTLNAFEVNHLALVVTEKQPLIVCSKLIKYALN